MVLGGGHVVPAGRVAGLAFLRATRTLARSHGRDV